MASALTIDEATAQLTAAGQLFETEQTVVNGVEMTVWKYAPTNLRQVLDLSLRHANLDFLVYEDTRYTFEQHYRIASTLAQRILDAGADEGRSGRDRRAKPSRVGHGLLGGEHHRCGRDAAQRMVDNRRAHLWSCGLGGVRPVRR